MSGENMTWRERIAEARERGGFREYEKEDADCSWDRCAVGEIRREHRGLVVIIDGRPADNALWDLGRGFGAAVRFLNDPSVAEKFLDAIEDRALELKRASAASQPEGLRP